MTKIKKLHQDKNVTDLSFTTHSLKGITSNIGGDNLYEYIKAIEPKLKNGKLPQDQEIQKLEILYVELVREIEGFLRAN